MFKNLDFSPLNYKFTSKPLLVGGKAKEYYKIRKSGDDIDLIVTAADYKNLAELYPKNLKNLFGDSGVCVKDFEIWKTIFLFDYDFFSVGAVEKKDYKIISLEKLLVLTALGIKKEKLRKDLKLIVEKISETQYRN